MRRARAITGSARGFFLLDALLTLILLSMIVVLFTSSLHLGQRMRAASRQNDQLAAFTAGIDAIVGLLGRAVAVAEISEAQSPVVLFEGGPTRFALFALSQGEANVGGLLAAEIRFVPNRDNGVIELRTALLPLGERPLLGAFAEGGNWATLVQHVRAAEFRFFGSKAGEPATWHARWGREALAPRFVSLRLRVWMRDRHEDFEYTFALGG